MKSFFRSTRNLPQPVIRISRAPVCRNTVATHLSLEVLL